ncbi:MAG TPA: PEGA domain-containing protein [Polyangiaceae bacterium]
MVRAYIPIFLLVSLSTAFAAAQEGDAEETAIEPGIQQGISLRRSGKDDAALAVFLDLEKRAPSSVRVLLHVTAAAQATGRWIMAYDYLQKAARFKNDPYYVRHRSAIKQVEDSVAQHVGQFRAFGSPEGAEVRLNGEVIGTLPMTEGKPVTAGSYVLEVSKPGYYPLRRSVNVAAGGTLTQEAVELGVQEALPNAGRPQLTGEARSNLLESDGGTRPTGLSAPWITWALAGTSLALAATSGVAFVVRENKVEEWNDESTCLDPTTPTRTRQEICGDIRDSAKTAEAIGIGTGIAAVTVGGLAIVHLLARSDGEKGFQVGSHARVFCSPGLASLACQGSF